jgi:hypothetical protein
MVFVLVTSAMSVDVGAAHAKTVVPLRLILRVASLTRR